MNVVNEAKTPCRIQLVLSEIGKIVNECWNKIPEHFENVLLDESVVMPNHSHGIIIIENDFNSRKRNAPCRGGVTPPLQRITLGNIVAYFKYQSTKIINKIKNTPGERFWQRNYYEHVIRNETELNAIREYILNNPFQWEFDHENPNRAGARPTPNVTS